MKENKFFTILGWVASVTGILMYVSYIPQIIDNLHGAKGNPIQPLATAINTFLWVIYALFKKERDIPLAVANMAGVVFGLIAFFTAI
ncbi:SemiSWEET family transporter [Lactobacillus sp. ESL0684]|uniref:SemiSWEET family transporter n=1 Tax=unclassified Lactobacillus TaxID=2620435 RepID=UPI0023F9DA1B|nr:MULTISPECIES: SemiSWEET family transporter [unclassified Lactobacillus]WEV39982.1 SemiSWEET family transporter [Lactobacillus sp. ESL0681]WEV43477.1 SemiSWEET family transporter [Lactobacillus sp. ESL0684]